LRIAFVSVFLRERFRKYAPREKILAAKYFQKTMFITASFWRSEVHIIILFALGSSTYLVQVC
jgi:hypothetical protein